MIQEFISEVEAGFGFIFSEDVEKYYEAFGGETLDEDTRTNLFNKLREANLLRDR